jgi:hypothetical protein
LEFGSLLIVLQKAAAVLHCAGGFVFILEADCDQFSQHGQFARTLPAQPGSIATPQLRICF